MKAHRYRYLGLLVVLVFALLFTGMGGGAVAVAGGNDAGGAPITNGVTLDMQLDGFDNTTCNAPRNEWAHYTVRSETIIPQYDNTDNYTGNCGQVYWKHGVLPHEATYRVKPTRHLANCVATHWEPGYLIYMGFFRGGDINNDNTVDVSDFGILHTAFGKCVGMPGYNPTADLNDDGCVDVTDFTIVKANFGYSGCSTLEQD